MEEGSQPHQAGSAATGEEVNGAVHGVKTISVIADVFVVVCCSAVVICFASLTLDLQQSLLVSFATRMHIPQRLVLLS